MRIQHNVTAMNSYRNFSTNNSSLAKNLEKLSSGYKINRAGDDAAGLAISEKMRAQISGLEGATKNAKDGISLVQTAEGALTEVHDMLNRMYTLAEQSANGTYEDGVDRAQLQKEVDQLRTEIDRIADSANFNGLKLLNGDLGAVAEDSISIEDAASVDFTDGITVSDEAGKGAKSTFELSLDELMGEGDTITLEFSIPKGEGAYDQKKVTLTWNENGAATSKQFNGVSKSAQLTSIKNALTNGTATFDGETTTLGSIFMASGADAAGEMNVEVKGDKLVFTAGAEAEVNALHLSGVSVNNVDAGVTSITKTSGTNTSGGTLGNYGVTHLLTGDDHYQAGDKLQFDFTLNGGKTATATVEITQDMIDTNSTERMTSMIANALANTSFDDNETTSGFDESQFKVSDFFTVTGNVAVADGSTAEMGSISIKPKDSMSSFALSDVKFAAANSDSYSTVHTGNTNASRTMVNYTSAASPAMSTASSGATAATQGKVDITVDKNLTAGDTFTLEGKLADGRSFSVSLTGKTSAAVTANNEFNVAGTVDGTYANIKSALQSNAWVDVTDSKTGEVSRVKASDIFGTADATAGSSFKVEYTDADNKLTVTAATVGKLGTAGIAGDITNAKVTAGTAPAVTGTQTVDGVDQDAAKVTMTFNKDEIEYGTSVTIGSGINAKTFELVNSDSAEVSSQGNVRVVVSDLARASQDDVMDAFRDAINDELVTNYDASTNTIKAGSTGQYTDWAVALKVAADTTTAFDASTNNHLVTVDDNTLTIETVNKGGSVKAIGGANNGGVSEGKTIDFLKNDDGSFKLSAGDTIKINGNTYQFDTTTRNLQGDNKLIKVSDFSDKEAIAEAVKLAVEEEDGTVSARINEDYSVTLGAANVDGTYSTPTVEQTLSGGGLTLQIGDTSDDFNKLKINIRDMHVDSIGQFEEGDAEMALISGKSIGDIDISTQDGAAEALDVIKSAINMVSDVRGTLGASQNRLEHTINNLGVMRENIQNAESAIRDTDVAEEMMTYTKNNILVQSAQAMLAQANQLPQGVLQLLG